MIPNVRMIDRGIEEVRRAYEPVEVEFKDKPTIFLEGYIRAYEDAAGPLNKVAGFIFSTRRNHVGYNVARDELETRSFEAMDNGSLAEIADQKMGFWTKTENVDRVTKASKILNKRKEKSLV